MSKSPWAHFLHVKAQKVINYRALFSYPFWYSLFKIEKKSLEPFLPKLQKSAILAQIYPFCVQNGGGGLFFKNLLRTLFIISGFPTSCQISRKLLERFPRKTCYRHPDGRTSGQESFYRSFSGKPEAKQGQRGTNQKNRFCSVQWHKVIKHKHFCTGEVWLRLSR